MTDQLVDGLCAPCRDGEHQHCLLELGCSCWGRWSPDERAVVLCEALTERR